MTDIDAIVELSKTLAPSCPTHPEVHLWCDTKGKWHANAYMDRYFVDALGKDTPEEALHGLRSSLVTYSQNFLSRLTDRLKRWTVSTALRVVK